MTDTLQSTAQQATSTAQSTASQGADKWNAMSEEQKQKTFDALPADQKKGKTSYYEWIKAGYHQQYENWMPWIEDQYLKWFTKDNKTSYTAKQNLDKTKLTGISQVDQLQDGVNGLVAGQVGQGGLLQPVGDAVSKEGLNRAERGGKDNKGTYGGAAASVTDPIVQGGKSGVQGVSGAVTNGAKSAGGYVSGLWGGKKEEGQQQQQQAAAAK